MIRLRLKYSKLNLRFREWEERQWCFNFALKNKKLQYCEDAYDIIRNKYNKVIALQDAQKGDIVTFHHGTRSPSHFGIISKTNGFINGTYIHSKWGRCRVVKCRLLDIDKHYGSNILIWRKK
jgi:hypothetical protein